MLAVLTGFHCTVNFLLTDTSLRRTLNLVPAVYWLFYYNQTLSKTDTWLRRTTDTFKRFKIPPTADTYWLINRIFVMKLRYFTVTETTCVQKISTFFVVCLATGHTLLCLTDNNSKLYYCSFIKTQKGKYTEVSPICKGSPKTVKKERF